MDEMNDWMKCMDPMNDKQKRHARINEWHESMNEWVDEMNESPSERNGVAWHSTTWNEMKWSERRKINEMKGM